LVLQFEEIVYMLRDWSTGKATGRRSIYK